jgi:hypothetical protein
MGRNITEPVYGQEFLEMYFPETFGFLIDYLAVAANELATVLAFKAKWNLMQDNQREHETSC